MEHDRLLDDDYLYNEVNHIDCSNIDDIEVDFSIFVIFYIRRYLNVNPLRFVIGDLFHICLVFIGMK